MRLELSLIGANLDTQHAAKLAQLQALQRMLRVRQSTNLFAAVMWGDMNHRLVAYEELRPHVRSVGPGDFELTASGTEALATLIADPRGRRELLQKDSLLFRGRDLEGRQCEVLPASVLLRSLFALHIDAVLEGRLEVPLPFYKHTPPEIVLSERLGCRLKLDEVALAGNLRLPMPQRWLSDLQTCYFGWKQKQRVVKSDEDDPAMYLQLGWLDGVGIYRGGSARAELRVWETEDQVLAFDHLPLRALVDLSW